MYFIFSSTFANLEYTPFLSNCLPSFVLSIPQFVIIFRMISFDLKSSAYLCAIISSAPLIASSSDFISFFINCLAFCFTSSFVYFNDCIIFASGSKPLSIAVVVLEDFLSLKGAYISSIT